MYGPVTVICLTCLFGGRGCRGRGYFWAISWHLVCCKCPKVFASLSIWSFFPLCVWACVYVCLCVSVYVWIQNHSRTMLPLPPSSQKLLDYIVGCFISTDISHPSIDISISISTLHYQLTQSEYMEICIQIVTLVMTDSNL